MQLRLTRRALDDLGLSADFALLPATDYRDQHDVIACFVEKREQSPIGAEVTQLPVTAVTAFNLHCGRFRGLTWHDEESDVVWLLGVGWHESGSRDDAYEVLKGRDTQGLLMPDEQDYLDLEATLEEEQAFVAQVNVQAPALVDEARARGGVEVRGIIAGRLSVGVTVEAVEVPGEGRIEEVWVAFEMPPVPGECRLPPHPQWIMVVLAAMVAVEVRLEDLDFDGQFPRPGGSRPNEIVVAWRL